MTQAMTWLMQTKEAVAKGAAIHYRVFFLADDCEVELVQHRPRSRIGPTAEPRGSPWPKRLPRDQVGKRSGCILEYPKTSKILITLATLLEI